MKKKTKIHDVNGHPEFAISYDVESVIENDVDWFVSFLEESVKGGRNYTDGETFQVGWMFNMVQGLSDGTLALLEPDLCSVPLKWVESVTSTLKILRLQKSIAESYALESKIQFPTIRHSVIVGVDVVPETSDFILERVSQEISDSGWFVGDSHSSLDYNDSSNLNRLSLYELGCKCPGIVMFFALPEGVRIAVSQRKIELFYNDRLLKPKGNSFVTKLQE